jgi:hypothetical protein
MEMTSVSSILGAILFDDTESGIGSEERAGFDRTEGNKGMRAAMSLKDRSLSKRIARLTFNLFNSSASR